MIASVPRVPRLSISGVNARGARTLEKQTHGKHGTRTVEEALRRGFEVSMRDEKGVNPGAGAGRKDDDKRPE
ncbi:hypothetical protein ABID08_003266 [Rhizobium binae]|uniref:Uncharacterized protein n=1 Tax=Rhizobium binae TaxID=1138190 RepID=A0ABV2MHE7_9HYPH|nr:hypothetical protein [Rhizobium binae]MBX4991413.1 hypothetical protein [Rhizobium binae]NKL48520.1 hypothetical protein [Rhizobium leguminosarum bv. viciae]QSY81563.1 hypothetical protein J2J99_18195 [Rhizobium binae]